MKATRAALAALLLAVALSQTTIKDGSFSLTYNANTAAGTIAFTMSYPCTGYVAFGFGPSNVHFSNSDTYVGYVNSAGTAIVYDGSSNSQSRPVNDATQNALNPTGSLTNGVLTISFSRKLNTGDNADQVITTGASTLVGWGISNTVPTGPTAYNKHSNFGTFQSQAVTFAGVAAPTTAPPTLAPATGPSFTTGNYQVSWTVDQTAGTVTFTMLLANGASQYTSIGFGPSGTLGHKGTDMYMFWMPSTGAVQAYDGYSTSTTLPVQDAQQDATVISGSATGGSLQVKWSRKLNTGDTNDYTIANAMLDMSWAYGTGSTTTTAPNNYHGGSRGDVQVNLFSLTAVTSAPTVAAAPTASGGGSAPAAGAGALSFTSGPYSVNWKIPGDGTIVFTMALAGGANQYTSIGFGPSNTVGHQGTDMYMFWMPSTGAVQAYDGFSNSKTTPTKDTSQDATIVSGATTNGNLNVVWSRKLNTGDTAGDYVIGNALLDLSWAYGSGSTSTAVPTAYHGPSPARGDLTANLISGQTVAPTKSIDPALQLMIGVLVVSFVYFLFRVGNKLFKYLRRMDEQETLKALSANPGFAPLEETEEPENEDQLEGNPSGAYYFRGSVAVAYKKKHGNHTTTSGEGEPSSFKSSMNDLRNSYNKFHQNTTGGSKDDMNQAFLSTLSPEKKAQGGVGNVAHKIISARIPRSHISVLDVLIIVIFLAYNALILFSTSLPKYTAGLTWGYLATANCLLVALPATRNSVLVWMLGVPFDKAIMYHRWIGRLAILQATVHWYYYLGTQATYGQKYWYGVGAWIGMLIIYVTSINYIRRRHFNLFFSAHFAFVILYVLGAYHSVQIVTIYSYIAAAVYGLDRVIRFFWGAFPRKTVSIEVIAGAVRIRFPKHFAASYEIGQYVFVNFPELGFRGLWEWHPFTLASGPDESCCEIMIKGLGDHTKQLMAAAQNKQQLWIRVDGPYGKWPFNFFRYKAAVLVAGGVGVTPSIATIRHIFLLHREGSNEINPHLSDLYFIWSCKSEEELEWYRADIEAALERSALKSDKFPTLHLHLHVTTPKDPESLPGYARSGRPDLNEVFNRVESLPGEALRAAVVACGPAVMVNEAWDQCVKRTGGKHRFDFHHETFEF